jgi:hypothetical protein
MILQILVDGNPNNPAALLHDASHHVRWCHMHVQVFSCVQCKRVVDWLLMPDAESPQTVFQWLYTRVPRTSAVRLAYDNGCQLTHYIANRCPDLLKRCRIYIDHMHFEKGHSCSEAYDTSMALNF